MEIIRIQKADGEDVCYIRCEDHNYWYKNSPPLTVGCRSCWLAYYLGQRAQMKPELMDMGLDELEAALKHMEEELHAGKWDLELYDRPIIDIQQEN